jgi:lipopolysaccharide export LptBFGC system permease protein LptF
MTWFWFLVEPFVVTAGCLAFGAFFVGAVVVAAAHRWRDHRIESMEEAAHSRIVGPGTWR